MRFPSEPNSLAFTTTATKVGNRFSDGLPHRKQNTNYRADIGDSLTDGTPLLLSATMRSSQETEPFVSGTLRYRKPSFYGSTMANAFGVGPRVHPKHRIDQKQHQGVSLRSILLLEKYSAQAYHPFSKRTYRPVHPSSGPIPIYFQNLPSRERLRSVNEMDSSVYAVSNDAMVRLNPKGSMEGIGSSAVNHNLRIQLLARSRFWINRAQRLIGLQPAMAS